VPVGLDDLGMPAADPAGRAHDGAEEAEQQPRPGWGSTHPGDVVPVYQDLAAVHVRRTSKPGYLEAIKYLKMAQGLAERAGAKEDFRAFMTELRAAHPGKKVLHQQLSEAGLP